MVRFAAHIITVSDGVHHGTRIDESGDRLEAVLVGAGFAPVERAVVPDEEQVISEMIRRAASIAHLVVTTGGTGFGPRDVTPEATVAVVERPAPGLVQLMLARGIASTPMAALSRPVAGAIGNSLVINLPGSPRGAVENLEAVLDILAHALTLLSGDTEHA